MFEIDLQKHKPSKKIDTTYLCNVRKRLITATPEEEVRQSVINFLVSEKGYPIGNIYIEVPMAHFKKGAKGRADILIKDNDEHVICLIECKGPNEVLTDNIFDQLLKYDEIVKAETFCIVIGSSFYFYAFVNEDKEPKLLSDFPSFKTLMEEGQVDYFLPEEVEFEKYIFKEPFEEDIVTLFYEQGIFGKDTDRKYLSFLFNLYNFYIDENDKLTTLKDIEDIGLKVTKYGNASGGQFFGNYRGFLENLTKSIVSFSISSMTRGDGFPVNTSLMFAVYVKGNFHLSLELRVDKYVNITNTLARITHDGTITIGKLGSAKRSELLDFVKNNKPNLIQQDQIYLGCFDISREIIAEKNETKEFIKNCIDYAIVRDQFRAYKKGIS